MKTKLRIVLLSAICMMVMAGCGGAEQPETEESVKKEAQSVEKENVVSEESSKQEEVPIIVETPEPEKPEMPEVDERYEYVLAPDLKGGPEDPIIGFNALEGWEEGSSASVNNVYYMISFSSDDSERLSITVETEARVGNWLEGLTEENDEYVLTSSVWKSQESEKKADVETPFGTAEVYHLRYWNKYDETPNDAIEYAVLDIGGIKVLFIGRNGTYLNNAESQYEGVLEKILPQMFELE